MASNTGELKQEILKVYNVINKNIFNVGVRQQHVDFVGNKIIIISANTRVPMLKMLDDDNADSMNYVDYLLSQTFKKKIKTELEKHFKFNIITVFKDYDKLTEYSGTIIFLDRDVENYLKEQLEL